jgi:hypothetical protein
MGMWHQKVPILKPPRDFYTPLEAFVFGEVISWQRKAINASLPLC